MFLCIKFDLTQHYLKIQSLYFSSSHLLGETEIHPLRLQEFCWDSNYTCQCICVWMAASNTCCLYNFLTMIQKHFVWLRIPVFLFLSLPVFLSVCVCKWERPQCLPAPWATLIDRWTVCERQTSLSANGKTGPLLSAWWQLLWVIASGPTVDGLGVRPVSF